MIPRRIDEHWSDHVLECQVSTGEDGKLNLTVEGGSDNGDFAYFGGDPQRDGVCYVNHGERLLPGDVILEIQEQKVAGYTQRDVVAWLNHCCRTGHPVSIKAVRAGYVTRDLRTYLNARFQKGSLDHDLQNTIRDNLYLRTVPCTTRPPRDGEVNGVDYTFLTPEEFMALERSGNLLESGVYEGNHYGTPKPPKENPTSPPWRPNSIGNSVLPGAHPSSEGKRRRNRSNVEAMAAKSIDAADLGDPQPRTRSSTSSSMHSGPRSSGDPNREGDNILMSSTPPELGPLPENWEKAFTPNGEPYFIDHNTGTSQWLDPRMARLQKKAIEECDEDELPYGWERIDDPHYGTYFIDHVNRRTQYENPVLQAKRLAQNGTNTLSTLWHRAPDRSSGSSSNVCLRSEQWLENGDGSAGVTAADRSVSRLVGANQTNSHGHSRHPNYVFTRNPEELQGEFVRTFLMKSPRGFGFTIVGGDDEGCEEFLQIKSVVPNGPAWLDGKLQTGDVLVYVNDVCVLGYSHQDVVTLFQSIPVGDTVQLEVCRGYPLPFDPDDPNTEIVTTVAVTDSRATSGSGERSPETGIDNGEGTDEAVGPDSAESMTRFAKSMPDLSGRQATPGQPQRHNSADLLNSTAGERTPDILDFNPQSPNKPEFLTVEIVKGGAGFGFTIADSAYGQKVKKILDRPRCKLLQEGDILVEINNKDVRGLPHAQVVQVLKDCPCGDPARVTVQRGGLLSPLRGRARVTKIKSADGAIGVQKGGASSPVSQALFLNNSIKEGYLPPVQGAYRSKTPTADLYSSRDKEAVVVSRPKTPLVDTRNWPKPLNNGFARTHNEQHRTPGTMQELPSPSLSEAPTGDYRGSNEMPSSSYAQNSGRLGSSTYGESEKGADVTWNNLSFRSSGRPEVGQTDRRGNYVYNHILDDDAAGSFLPYRQDIRAKTPVGFVPVLPMQESDSSRSAYTKDWHDVGALYLQNNGTYSPDYNRPEYKENVEQQVHTNVGHGAYYQSGYQYPVSGHSQLQDPLLSSPARQDGVRYSHSSPSFPPHLRGSSQYDSLTRRKHSTSFEHEQPVPSPVYPAARDSQTTNGGFGYSPYGATLRQPPIERMPQYMEMSITLERQESGFGFRIVGGTEEGSQVSIGHIVPGGAADLDGRLRSGDEIIFVDNQAVINTSHHHVVQLMGNAAIRGRVTLGIRRRITSLDSLYYARSSDGMYPYDVTVTRKENEGFGFVIISSVSRAGSTIGRIIENSPAERCGLLHVGDRILAVSGISILNMHHGEIVNLIKDSGYSATLTIGPPQDDTSSTASTSQRGEDPSVELDDQYYAVELHRGTRGFGFSIRGGKEFHNMPLFVLRIAENGPAYQDGHLQVGDQIIEINGINTKNMTHAEAIEIIRQGGNVVRLLVRRGPKIQLSVGDQLSPVNPNGPYLQPAANGPVSQSSPRMPQDMDVYGWGYGP